MIKYIEELLNSYYYFKSNIRRCSGGTISVISVIVPVYNVEKYLKFCISSIINQTYKDLEILLIDDGSTDRCLEICDEFSKMDNRIIVVHKENGGLSSARNVGIKMAKGEYIIFVDSDDYIHPTMIDKMYELIMQGNTKLGICNVYKVGESDNLFYNNNKDIRKKQLSNRQAMLGMCKDWKYVVAWNKIYHKSIFDNAIYKVGIVNEDLEIILKIYNSVEAVMLTNEILYYYRQRDDSIVSSSQFANNKYIFNIYRIRDNYFCSHRDKTLIKSNLWDMIYRYYDVYWLNEAKVTEEMLLETRKELSYYLRKHGRLLDLKTRVKLFIFIVSPNISKIIKNILGVKKKKQNRKRIA